MHLQWKRQRRGCAWGGNRACQHGPPCRVLQPVPLGYRQYPLCVFLATPTRRHVVQSPEGDDPADQLDLPVFAKRTSAWHGCAGVAQRAAVPARHPARALPAAASAPSSTRAPLSSRAAPCRRCPACPPTYMTPLLECCPRFLQKSRVQIWLYEQPNLRLEGRIVVRGASACAHPSLGLFPRGRVLQ